jgi:hypothetical protein
MGEVAREVVSIAGVEVSASVAILISSSDLDLVGLLYDFSGAWFG